MRRLAVFQGLGGLAAMLKYRYSVWEADQYFQMPVEELIYASVAACLAKMQLQIHTLLCGTRTILLQKLRDALTKTGPKIGIRHSTVVHITDSAFDDRVTV